MTTTACRTRSAAQLRKAPSVHHVDLQQDDGIVAWQCSINEPEPHTENIEVHASHIGMGMNPLALFAIADRLRQDPANWERFEARGAWRWFSAAPTRFRDYNA